MSGNTILYYLSVGLVVTNCAWINLVSFEKMKKEMEQQNSILTYWKSCIIPSISTGLLAYALMEIS